MFERRVAGSSNQTADTGEGEGKFLFDFEEGHCGEVGWRSQMFELMLH